jgi:hypothetical protein
MVALRSFLVATYLPASNRNGNGNGAASPPAPAAWSVDLTLRVIGELGRAIQEQCTRAQESYGDAPERSALREQIDALAAQGREIHECSQAIARQLAEKDDPQRLAAAPSPRSRQPVRTASANGSAETRECAVSLAVALKLDGVSRERTEALLVDEFGREDAAEIADEAFGPSRRAA